VTHTCSFLSFFSSHRA